MGQKTNPISNRIGITRGWVSNWCGGNYAEKIAEDYKIRKYLVNRLANASISKIVIERTLKLITVTIQAARPGVIIGKGGTAVDKLKEELKKVTSKDVQINIFEVRRPEVDANIVADSIARQIEGRVSYRRAIKLAVTTAMRMGAEGIKVWICNGEVYGKKDLSPNAGIANASAQPQGQGRQSRGDRGNRRGGRRGDRKESKN